MIIASTKNYLVALILFAAFLSLMSCRKEHLVNNNIFENDPKILWAKEHYRLRLSGAANSNPQKRYMGSNFSLDKQLQAGDNRTAVWQESTEGTTPLFEFVEVPLKYDVKIGSSLKINSGRPLTDPEKKEVAAAGFERLIIYKDKNGQINERVISFVPDLDYLRLSGGNISHNRIDSLDKKFNGYLIYKSWKSDPLFKIRIENGLPVSAAARPQSTKGTGLNYQKKMGLDGTMIIPPPGGEGCVTQEFDDYWISCFTFMSQLQCSAIWIGEHSETYCDGNGGGNDDGSVNCANPLNFQNAACVEILDIIDNLTDPCFKTSLAKATNAGLNNRIDSIIRNLNGNKKVKLTFSQLPTLVNSENKVVDAKTTNYAFDPVRGLYSASIIINSSVHNNSSQEYFVSTIIHEVLHGYLQYEAGTDIYHSQNHNEIANRYIIPFTQFMLSLFPNMEPREATALAWGGLKETNLWNANFANDTFQVTNSQEQMTSQNIDIYNALHRSGGIGSSKCAN